MSKTVGILAIQGSFAEHGKILESMGVEYIWVKDTETLQQITHLIIPGGESTTMRKLLEEFGMWEILEKRIKSGELKVFGTCAGAIILSEFMDITIERNAYGAQQASCVCPLESKQFPNLEGVFIRAPKITQVGQDVGILATRDSEPVLVQEGNLLASTFHPELGNKGDILTYLFKYL